jgi:hypothetical protein
MPSYGGRGVAARLFVHDLDATTTNEPALKKGSEAAKKTIKAEERLRNGAKLNEEIVRCNGAFGNVHFLCDKPFLLSMAGKNSFIRYRDFLDVNHGGVHRS